MSAEFDWQAAFHKEHDDLCHVEGENYVLRQHIKALQAALREIIAYETLGRARDDDELHVIIKMEDIARKALGEE